MSTCKIRVVRPKGGSCNFHSCLFVSQDHVAHSAGSYRWDAIDAVCVESSRGEVEWVSRCCKYVSFVGEM
jgi:hypothetical protein